MYDECYVNDDQDAEADYNRGLNRGHYHEVEVDVTIRVTIRMPGNNHESSELGDDLVSEQALAEGDIINIEEV